MNARYLLAALAVLALALAACDTAPTEDAEEPAPTTPEAEPTPDTPAADADDDALARIADAAAATAQEGSARFTITVELEDTDVGEGTQAISADGEEDFDAERRRITLEGPQGDLDLLIDGSTVYLQLPATEDDDWVRVELDRLVDADLGFGGPGGLPFQSPHNNLVLLSDTATQAAEAGEEDVDGEAATRYEVTLDLGAAAAEAEETTATRGQLEATVRQLGADELDMVVWIDDDDRIRRIEYSLDLDQVRVDEDVETDTPEADVDAEVEADLTGTAIVTVDYFDFGTTVAVDLPDEDEVVDLDEEELRGSFNGDRTGDA